MFNLEFPKLFDRFKPENSYFATASRDMSDPYGDNEEAYSSSLETMVVGGIRTARVTRVGLAEIMADDCRRVSAGELSKPKIVISSNGSVIARYHRDREFRKLVSEADIVDADGSPLVIASRWLGKHPLPERVATTDFIHYAATVAVREGLRFFFLGGKPGVAERAAVQLRMLHPGLQIVGRRDGFFSRSEEGEIRRSIIEAGTNVLWLGLGSPIQERVAYAWREELTSVGWIKTCGGLFDHVAGDIPRAPLWMQHSGLEWLHRMWKEPRRLAPRYLSTNPIAAYHLLIDTHD